MFASHYSTDEGYGSLGMFPSIDHFHTADGLDYNSFSSSDDELEKRRFTLRYPIVMPRLSAVNNSDPSLCPPWLKPTDRLTDQNAYPRFNVERDLETPTQNDIWDEKGKVATMQGQVTYWSRINADGGWDGTCIETRTLNLISSMACDFLLLADTYRSVIPCGPMYQGPSLPRHAGRG